MWLSLRLYSVISRVSKNRRRRRREIYRSGKRGKARIHKQSSAMEMDDRDRISRLPDEILLHILTFLPTKHAVSTCSLSHRWNDLGISRSLPIFDFQTPDVENWDTLSFVYFVYNLIRVNNSPTISKFRLKTHDFNRSYLSHVNEWIRFVISKCVIELDLEITLEGGSFFYYDVNCLQILRILACDSLQILKISSNFGLDMPISGPTFRNLRIFHLDFMGSPQYQVLVPKLFTDLPLLEELSIRARLWSTDGQTTFNIIAPALKIFVFTTVCTFPDIYDVKVVIDAPLLEKISLVEDCISSYSFKNCPNISEANICVGKHRVADFFDRGNESDASYYNLRAREILRAVSNAKYISLCSRAVLALLILPQIDLPLLPFLTKLELVIPCACAWKLLLPMLENSPNLEVLILTKMEYVIRNGRLHSVRQESLLADLIGGFEFIPPENLPTCLLLHLKEIEIRGVKKIEEVKVLDYVVKNTKVLKKLTVHPVRTTRHEIVALARFDGLQSFVM